MELEITNITEENKKEKLTAAALVLAYTLNIPLELNGVILEKDELLEKAYKYIRRWKKGEKWYYAYPHIDTDTSGKQRVDKKYEIAASAELIDYIKPIEPTEDNIKKEFTKLRQLSKEGKLRVKAYGNFPVIINKMSEDHLKMTKRHNRQKNAIDERASLLPFVSEILNNTGKLGEISRRKGAVTYGVVGRVKIGNEIKVIEISLAYNKQAKLFFLSGYEIKKVGSLRAIMGKKSLGQYAPAYYRPTGNLKTVIGKESLNQFVPTGLKKAVSQWLHGNSLIDSHTSNGGVDINSLQRHRSHRNNEAISSYFQPLLPNEARVNNSHPTNTILPQSTQKNKSYPDIILDIQNITEANKYDKFTKALKAAAKQLNTPIGVLDLEKKGEKHLYPIKQELSDYWASFYSNILDELYISLTEILELPAVSIETMQKSLISAQAIKKLFSKFKLKYKGSIIYNPETGEPFLRKDFDKLVRAIEDILNLNTKEAAKRITLDSVTVSKLLKRLASFQTTEQLKSHTLDNLKYKNKSFEWIREEYKNLNTVLGEPLSLKEKARYQVCEDKAAQLITRVNDDIRNGIKEVLLDGISERKSKAQVSQDLFNKFGSLNRNWKRIADTEIVNTSNLASVLEEVHSAAQGEKVYFRRYEMANACDKCKKMDGVIALWSDKPLEDDKIKDEFASVAIWEGKAPDSKNNTLVVGALHPHCRGFWERWGSEEFNAQTAQLNGKGKKWNEAVIKAQEEYKARGIENPHDGTKGYKDRIREIYKTL
ncbi:hypothetical protein [Treponema pedis]|uniref:hypothetical protein n=1 Tax=Treponema pedis TaxID=409322 RepID=UPI003D259303